VRSPPHAKQAGKHNIAPPYNSISSTKILFSASTHSANGRRCGYHVTLSHSSPPRSSSAPPYLRTAATRQLCLCYRISTAASRALPTSRENIALLWFAARARRLSEQESIVAWRRCGSNTPGKCRGNSLARRSPPSAWWHNGYRGRLLRHLSFSRGQPRDAAARPGGQQRWLAHFMPLSQQRSLTLNITRALHLLSLQHMCRYRREGGWCLFR